MEEAIQISHLSKSYAATKAVDDLSMKVHQGEFFAFLGENGAGKSTTINIMTCQLKKDSGNIHILNHNIDTDANSIKRAIGVVFQDSYLDKELTVKENLETRAAFYKIYKTELRNRIEELNQLIEFKSLIKKPVGRLSGGQRRKIDIIRALLHKPQILILDEPTTGLDPQTRRQIWHALSQLRKEKNLTIFLTTHYMEEAENADEILILNHGKEAAFGSPFELKKRYSKDTLKLYQVKETDVKKLNLPYQRIQDHYQITIQDSNTVTQLILEHREIFRDYEIIKGNMDDVFLSVTGKKMEETL